jgi:hypothetical protein
MKNKFFKILNLTRNVGEGKRPAPLILKPSDAAILLFSLTAFGLACLIKYQVYAYFLVIPIFVELLKLFILKP